MRRWLVCSIIVLLSPLAPAQQQAIPRLGETIDVSIVNVDVFVTDRQGNRVHGLTRDDFQIFEDGKLQPITNFAEYSGQPSNAPAAVTATTRPAEQRSAARQKRTLVIFVDRFSLPR